MIEYIKREDVIDAVLDVYYNTPDIDLTEDAFVFAGIDNPFCCSGKRKGGVDNG